MARCRVVRTFSAGCLLEPLRRPRPSASSAPWWRRRGVRDACRRGLPAAVPLSPRRPPAAGVLPAAHLQVLVLVSLQQGAEGRLRRGVSNPLPRPPASFISSAPSLLDQEGDSASGLAAASPPCAVAPPIRPSPRPAPARPLWPAGGSPRSLWPWPAARAPLAASPRRKQLPFRLVADGDLVGPKRADQQRVRTFGVSSGDFWRARASAE